MKLGYSVGVWSAHPPADLVETAVEAERLGFDSVWTAEAYGSDALTPLAWIGSQTSTIRLGTAIAQLSARTPTATAMAAITLDHLSGGRLALGLGASGPQVVEGWYGQPYPRPLERTREYVEVVRRTLAREAPVEFAGKHYQLPHRGGTDLGKPLKSTVHPLRTDLPVLLAAEGPKNVALAAEVADGWISFFLCPANDRFYRDALAEGLRSRPDERGAESFEVIAPTPVVFDEDVHKAADALRSMLALYIGGMGARGVNFHYEVFARLGYEAACQQIQEHYLDGDHDAAIAAVPFELVDEVALIGPEARVRDRLALWEDTCITTMVISGGVNTLRRFMDIAS